MSISLSFFFRQCDWLSGADRTESDLCSEWILGRNKVRKRKKGKLHFAGNPTLPTRDCEQLVKSLLFQWGPHFWICTVGLPIYTPMRSRHQVQGLWGDSPLGVFLKDFLTPPAYPYYTQKYPGDQIKVNWMHCVLCRMIFRKMSTCFNDLQYQHN